jgi:hypothetical protein
MTEQRNADVVRGYFRALPDQAKDVRMSHAERLVEGMP